MAENEIEEVGMTIGEFFRIVFSQKWIALAILVVVTVAGTLGIYLGKNAMSKSYDVSFTLELPQTEVESSASVVYYPDGTPFYYTDIVSLETLKAVKESNSEFKDINVEKLSESGKISISRSILETANNSGSYEVNYTLSVKARYFPDKEILRDYVTALINKPIEALSSMNINYDVYIDSARIAPDYVTEITQLIAQTNYLIGRYETYIDIYNDLSIDGKSLRSYAQEMRSYLNDSAELEILLAETRQYGYLKSESLKDTYETELYMLERQYKIASETLKNLLTIKEGSDSLSVSSAAIIKSQSDLVAELAEEIREIKEIYQISEYYGDKVPQNFLDRLDEAYLRVEAFTEEFEQVITKLYSKVSVISYSNSNVIVESGVTGLTMSFAISFIAGLVLAIIVAFVVGLVKNKKHTVREEKAVAAPLQDNPDSTENDNQ